jgi:hypothetical protein
MPIIDSEEGATWPVRGVLELGLNDIKDYGDTVFVIVPDNTLMSVRCIRGYYTVALAGILCRLIGLYKLDDGWIQFILNSSRIIHEIVMKGCRRVHRPRALKHVILGETARIVVRTLMTQVVIGGASPIPALGGRVAVKCASG